MTSPHSIAILGAGAMGSALAKGLLGNGWRPEHLTLAEVVPERAERVRSELRCECVSDPAEAVRDRAAVVVAVKPQDMETLMEQVAGAISPEQLVITLAAGVRIATLENVLGDTPVVRVMPNTPSLLGKGIAGLAGGSHAGSRHMAMARMVMEAVGEVVELEEADLDAVTAVSGSGPAYVFALAEAMTEAAFKLGLAPDVAARLVNYTVLGSGEMLVRTGQSAAHLRKQVASPGGTTAAALAVMNDDGFLDLMVRAVEAAHRRSVELGG
ncbi:MAG: pyrroline-5-carboxylate reductase [Acidimicrobiia bacterium]|nr:pyrroline-5-carboxylate reductase [Acidimicrobiia bacterium]MXY74256.1 pyrroline-5-carboxylate reductase [Acidimicrobiia bacterium]MYA39692.1 pyrroline-5-carboxylate reductase [Acidimicrobiia bacterium]MYB77987.1 pyrroline-5-carboxylate reductase [Acidimicrobiia bacterium]MYD41094.1 pyrroline-5-carboxylate reductase [Acidimicrobiia bacterium]